MVQGPYFNPTKIPNKISTRSLILVPWSIHLLVALIGIFSLKTVFGYARALAPELAIKYALVEVVGSAIVLGFLFGRSVNFVKRFLAK